MRKSELIAALGGSSKTTPACLRLRFPAEFWAQAVLGCVRRRVGSSDKAEPQARADRTDDQQQGRENGNREQDQQQSRESGNTEQEQDRDRGNRDRQQNRDGGDRQHNRDGGDRQQNRDGGNRESGGRNSRRRRGANRSDRDQNRGDRDQSRNRRDDSEPEVGEDEVLVPVAGIPDVLDNYAFLRTTGYLPGPTDAYLSLGLVKKYSLRKGDHVVGAIRPQRDNENSAEVQPAGPYRQGQRPGAGQVTRAQSLGLRQAHPCCTRRRDCAWRVRATT